MYRCDICDTLSRRRYRLIGDRHACVCFNCRAAIVDTWIDEDFGVTALEPYGDFLKRLEQAEGGIGEAAGDTPAVPDVPEFGCSGDLSDAQLLLQLQGTEIIDEQCDNQRESPNRGDTNDPVHNTDRAVFGAKRGNV